MNGNLLFADHAERIVMIGKNPITANTASNPKSTSATTQPGATGISATNAAAAATNSTGAAQKIGLSAFAGIIISLEINFNHHPLIVKYLQLYHSKKDQLLIVILPSSFFQQKLFQQLIMLQNRILEMPLL